MCIYYPTYNAVAEGGIFCSFVLSNPQAASIS